MSHERIPSDADAEAAVLGAVLLSPPLLGIVVGESGLRPEHFYSDMRRRAFDVMLDLEENGEPIDTLTVGAECAVRYTDMPPERWRDGIAMFLGRVPVLAHTRRYAERVVECARLRALRQAGLELAGAASSEDWTTVREIEGVLLTGTPTHTSYDPEELGSLVYEYLEGGHEVFPLPLPKLNKLVNGGLRRGALTLVSGYTSMGKSVLVDQILEHAALSTKLRVHLYINEMTVAERGLRFVSRLARVPFDRLEADQLSLDENKRVMAWLGKLPVGITEVAGWTAQDIARDIRSRKWDIAAVDIFHSIAGGNLTTDLDEKSRVLNQVTKTDLGNCHLLLCAHITKPAERGGVPKPPNGSNLRGTGSLENDADNVLFVHRDVHEESLRRMDTGFAYFTKVRNGKPGRVRVEFDGAHMEFAEATVKKGQNAINDDVEGL